MRTSQYLFNRFCCRYSDSFIDIYHGVSNLMIDHEQGFDLMVISRRVS